MKKCEKMFMVKKENDLFVRTLNKSDSSFQKKQDIILKVTFIFILQNPF